MMRRALAAIPFMLAAAAQAAAPDPMQYGRAYMAEGDYAAAAQSFSDALRANPADPVALNNLAVAKAAAGDYLTALDYLLRAQKLAPADAIIRDNLAHLRQWAKNAGGTATAADSPDAPQVEPPPLWPLPPGRRGSVNN